MYKLFYYSNISSKEAIDNTLDKFNIKEKEIIYNKYGKPYLKNKEIYFNLAHSNGVIVVAVSSREIGVDIQRITFKKDVIIRAFNSKEQEMVRSSLVKEEEFTKIWVKKEAYVKMLGIGLEYGLSKVDTTKIKCYLVRNGDYYIAVCEG